MPRRLPHREAAQRYRLAVGLCRLGGVFGALEQLEPASLTHQRLDAPNAACVEVSWG